MNTCLCAGSLAAVLALASATAFGQPPPAPYPPASPYPPPAPAPYAPPPPVLGPAQLDPLVQRIALYPDPLLAQVLTASTYYNEIPDAAGWANQHAYLTGDALAHAIEEDHLNFDPSVMALLPFPSVLDMMARDMGWTQALGNAVLAQRAEVMDAVQRNRQAAAQYGYLRNTPQYRVVTEPGDIEILPVDPAYLYVPVYDPGIVFYRPRPGFFIGGAISFGPRIFLGVSFAPFGWRGPGFGWRTHDIIIDNHAWGRDYRTRATYVHPYVAPVRRYSTPRVEHHEVHREERRR